MSHFLISTAQTSANDNQEAAYSDDANSWTTATTTTLNTGAGVTWDAAAYAPDIDIAVILMKEGSAGNPTAGVAMYSADRGVTWSPTGTNLNGFLWSSVCWAPSLGLFIAVANSTSTMATSPDGITWTTHNSGVAGGFRGVAWSPELGLAVAVGASNAVYHSVDGSTWIVAGTPPPTSRTWICVTWAGDGSGGGQQKFVAIANNGGSGDVAYSSDGHVWTQTSTGRSFTWTRLNYSPDLDMVGIVGGNTGVFTKSTNVAVSFTVITTGIGASKFNDVCWSKALGLWVMAGSAGTTLYTSPDAVTFTSHTYPAHGMGDRLIALDGMPGLAASFTDEATLAAQLSVALAASFTDEAALSARLTMPVTLDLGAVGFTDDAALGATISVTRTLGDLTAGFTDDAELAAVLSLQQFVPPPI